VAEDDQTNRLLISRMLQKLGHDCLCVPGGAQALEALRGGGFDLALMDIQMPGMDGLEATRAIRDADDAGLPRDIPIIALTAHALKGDRERFLKAGMDGYLAKPVALQGLYDLVQTYI